MSSVSVVIPCYRYGHYLEPAVASVLDAQPGVDVKVLIIDDASPDGSGEIATAIATADPRVEAVVHPTNRGHIATYNEGLLDWADSTYSVLMSADDLLTPGSLRRAVDLLDAHPGVGFAYGYAVRFRDGEPLPLPRTEPRGWSVWSGSDWLDRRFRLARSGISSPEVVVRTEVQQQVGGYDARLPHLADTQMWMRLASRADVGYVRGVDQAWYRQHADNMSLGYDEVAELRQGRVAFDSIIQTLADEGVDVSRMARLVHRKLAWEALFAATRAYDEGRAGDAPVDGLVAFARECWPHADRMPIAHTLRLRRLVGPRAMAALAPVVPPARGVRFLVESRDRYDTTWEAVEALARPGRQSVRFA
ncbi:MULTISPECIES: glycosyltransferase family 2 protein [unclassified Knoellia]|uniref:glycosyltransferase family 2 protein n=1 Tax=Knoellia altitudinis TaxID=3404795 RepID=UPI003614B3EA